MNTRILVLLSASAVFTNAQSCGRECLRGLIDNYLLGMTHHDAAKLNVTPAVKFTENGEAMKLGEGLWKTAGSVTYKLYALDPQGNAAAVEAVVKENGEQTTNVAVPAMNIPAASASEQLDKGFFKGLAVGKRRFPVVDVDHGLVLGIGLMSTPGPDGVLLAEMFKVTGGKIRQIQAVMVNHSKTGTTGWN